MIIRQTTTIVFEYPQDYLQEQEWCKTKEDRWIHKGTDTLGAVYENQISYSIGVSADRKTENSSEKPNNCEHITEDGVTCAKYPACDDCLDNPLNKIKGSERLVKGLDEETKTETQNSNLTFEKADEPQYEMGMGTLKCDNCSEYGSFKCAKCDGEMYFKRLEPKDEPQTERSE